MRTLPLVALVCGFALLATAEQKKKKDDETQTLQLPKELPAAVLGETRKLTFYVTPPSVKGLLSQQIRDALKALFREAGSDTILKIRALVAGSGDLRRVRDLVSEIFSDRRLPLPALSLIRTGGLPLEGAQVVLEAVASSRKIANPEGVVFISAQVATAENPLDPVPPLTAKSVAGLREAVKAAGSEAADVARVTCFLSSLEKLGESRQLVAAEYPRAVLNFAQTQRAPSQGVAACEAVARLRSKTGGRLELRNPEGLPNVPGESQIALVTAPHVVLTGSQNSFGFEEKDARLALERLQKALEASGATMRDVAYAHYYPLSVGIANQLQKVRAGFFDAEHPPAGSLLIFEGLPSMDAGFAVDVVAVKD